MLIAGLVVVAQGFGGTSTDRGGGDRAARAAAQPVLHCPSLAEQNFVGIRGAATSILSASVVPAGGGTPEYCDVKGYVEPQVQFELRLPTTSWNGRYFQAGCGFLCGQVTIDNCSGPLEESFAVAAQNMGHVGRDGTDGVWGRSDKRLRIDFAYRSTHVVALAAKAIVARYYGKDPAFSYFGGCSTGGVEALREAQDYPNDFDGIIAGDPAFYTRQGGISNAWFTQQLLTRDGSDVFTPAKLKLLNDAVLNACDDNDGLEDGIIADPRRCSFDPSTLACGAAGDGPDCLDAAQVESASALYGGPRDSHGRRLYPGTAPFGSELAWDSKRQSSISTPFLRDLAFSRPKPADYTPLDFDFDRDVRKLERWARVYDPVKPHGHPDLRAFQAGGGRLMVYHGWADASVSPLQTLDYYAEVAERQGGGAALRSWFRVFMIPGMGHCRGGNAPNNFGPTPQDQGFEGMLSAMRAWVEDGVAPERVLARQYDAAGRLVRSRPVFPYPLVAKYDGQGDVDDASSYVAAPPPQVFDDDQHWIWDPGRSDHSGLGRRATREPLVAERR